MNETDPSLNKKNKTDLKTKLAEFVSVIGQTLKGKRSSGNSLDEKPSDLDFSKLTFEQLQHVYEKIGKLAETTFVQNEYGFVDIRGEGVGIESRFGKFIVSGISEKLKDVHLFMTTSEKSILTTGSTDKSEMIEAVRKMLETLNYRIIE